MNLDWVPAKRDLGVVYLVGVGFIFTVMVFREAFGVVDPSLEQLLSLLAGFFLSVGLIAVGYWLFQSPLADEQVLVVAQWGALGMAVPTVIIVTGLLALPIGQTAGLLVTVIGAGGIVGALVGSVKALEEEHQRLTELYRRNKVLQRVLRHNIRNGMTVVQGYADLLEDDLDGSRADMLQHIRQEAGSIVDLSEMARNLDSLDADQYRRPMVLDDVLDGLLEGLNRNYPDATVQATVPGSVHVVADTFIELALWELLEWAIRNSPSRPVTITVSEGGAETVRTTIHAEEAVLSEDALAALDRGSETQMQHLDGLELWVAKWLIENMEGEIVFEADDESGTTMHIDLPAATQSPTTETPLESNAPPR